ncbi:DUF4173 domain-containing protein [Aminipila butyrica]|uniref:DUF4173 domain-containing protein n=1 Tax=Aminipila butyrica TaxID=433296 RepID=A0A858BTI9_9FIRM|nr:DUF4173 domain-containing protein [Aminipila butyrica]QIB68662.1 DUF4173 domain-containing protein [Aminipila butyrica]
MKYYYNESGGTNVNGQNQAAGMCFDIKSTERPPMVFRGADFWLAAALLACGFLYWNFILDRQLGLGITIFAAVLCTVTWIYLRAVGIHQNRKSVIWLALTAVSALQFAIFDGYDIKFLNLLFISGSFLLWVTHSTGRSLDIRLSIYTLWDLLNQLFMVPLSNLTCGYFSLKKGLGGNRHSRNALYMAAGVVIFLPLMVFVISQLSQADAAFEEMLAQMMALLSWNTLLTHLMQFVIGMPVAAYLFGSIYGNATGRNIEAMNRQSIERFNTSISFAPKITVYTVMALFNLIYLAFFLSQTAYFLSAFQNLLPETFTYAEYARRGFFELCKVSAVNGLLIMLANAFIRKGDRGPGGYRMPMLLRVQTGLLAILTMGLIATALRKMVLYISFYGLTQLRVYTSWFMVLLFFAFAVALIRQIKSFNSSRILLIGFMVGFMVLAYGNVDGNIAKYNIENYESGKLESIDYAALFRLSDGAAVYLDRWYDKTEDEEAKKLVYNYMVYGNAEGLPMYQERDFRDFNLQSSIKESLGSLRVSEGPPQP